MRTITVFNAILCIRCSFVCDMHTELYSFFKDEHFNYSCSSCKTNKTFLRGISLWSCWASAKMWTYFYFVAVNSILGFFANTVLMVVLFRKKKTVFDYLILCLSLDDGMCSLVIAARSLEFIFTQRAEKRYFLKNLINGVKIIQSLLYSC